MPFFFYHALPADDSYMGCFADSGTESILEGTFRRDPKNTINRCKDFCLETSPAYVYAGVRDGDMCHCGVSDNYAQLGEPLSDAECQSLCAGRNVESCGGTDRIAVFMSMYINPRTPKNQKIFFFREKRNPYLIIQIGIWQLKKKKKKKKKRKKKKNKKKKKKEEEKKKN